MSQFTYQEIVSQLQRGKVEIVFTKVDGTQRLMRCTLNAAYLPEESQDLEKAALLTEGDGDHELITVYDLDIHAWRRFRVSSVTSVLEDSMT